MSIWFILAMIGLGLGGGLFAVGEGKYAVAVLMTAGIMANTSALMMWFGME